MTTPRIPTGRAATPETKRAAVERLLAAWERSPHQRLGQLLDNALIMESLAGAVGLFGVEDEPLIAMVERFVEPGEIPPMATATNYTATHAPGASLPPWLEMLSDNDAFKVGLQPSQDAMAAIERGAFVAIAKVALRDGLTWDAVAAKTIASAEPKKLELAREVLDAARRRGQLEPGLMLLAGPPASPVESTAISSPTTAAALMPREDLTR